MDLNLLPPNADNDVSAFFKMRNDQINFYMKNKLNLYKKDIILYRKYIKEHKIIYFDIKLHNK